MRVVVAYDVSNDRRRLAVARHLLALGVRLQRSVFEVDTDDPAELLDELDELIAPATDTVHVFARCERCIAQDGTSGQAPADLQARWWIV